MLVWVLVKAMAEHAAPTWITRRILWKRSLWNRSRCYHMVKQEGNSGHGDDQPILGDDTDFFGQKSDVQRLFAFLKFVWGIKKRIFQ